VGRRNLLTFCLLLAIIAWPTSALALAIDLNVEFDGDAPGDYGDVTLSLVSIGGNDAVRFFVDVRTSAGGAGGSSADLSVFLFNYDDNSMGLNISGTDIVSQTINFSTTDPQTKAAGDGNYDIRLDFGRGSPTLQTTTFDVSLSGTDLSISNFASFPLDLNTQSVGGSNGMYTVAAHIQTTTTVAGSEWVGGNPTPTPEPATALLLGSGLLGLLGLSRKRFLKKS